MDRRRGRERDHREWSPMRVIHPETVTVISTTVAISSRPLLTPIGSYIGRGKSNLVSSTKCSVVLRVTYATGGVRCQCRCGLRRPDGLELLAPRCFVTAPPPATTVNEPAATRVVVTNSICRMNGEIKAVYSLYRSFLREVRRLPTEYLRYVAE